MKKLTKDFLKRRKLYHQRVKKCLFKSLQTPRILINYQTIVWNLAKNYILRNNWIHNYCLLTGQGRGVLRKYKLSRGQFKFYVNSGSFYSLKKISW
jgi:ribosomal protein S14